MKYIIFLLVGLLFISCETEEGYSEYPDIATELRRQDISKNTDSTEFEEID
jgi:hypothetical protein